jgi:hypothetical protein
MATTQTVDNFFAYPERYDQLGALLSLLNAVNEDCYEHIDSQAGCLGLQPSDVICRDRHGDWMLYRTFNVRSPNCVKYMLKTEMRNITTYN